VGNEYYFEAKAHLNSIRFKFCRKVALIRSESTLINLVHSFFPDIYIHDIKVEFNIYSGKREISVNFLTFEDRGIAIGRNGDYIKAVNKLLEVYIVFQNNEAPIKISCEVIKLNH